ncbi:unnamed protein product [Paramecium octaurelia]|uniref:NECAP PHear domain-containing protein n=1 Tax=Paramecium octaurelia TaxID=43137 RepID=A0A8S1SKC4_PAROT|nr:unnamed protein product [Paramecium octaurelia]
MSIEYVLLVKQQQVCLFKIPPVSSSKGYYLDDWKEMFWEGGIKLTEKGGLLTLYFIDKNTSAVQTFVNLPDNPYQAIEKTVDSQRQYINIDYQRICNKVSNSNWRSLMGWMCIQRQK